MPKEKKEEKRDCLSMEEKHERTQKGKREKVFLAFFLFFFPSSVRSSALSLLHHSLLVFQFSSLSLSSLRRLSTHSIRLLSSGIYQGRELISLCGSDIFGYWWQKYVSIFWGFFLYFCLESDFFLHFLCGSLQGRNFQRLKTSLWSLLNALLDRGREALLNALLRHWDPLEKRDFLALVLWKILECIRSLNEGKEEGGAWLSERQHAPRIILPYFEKCEIFSDILAKGEGGGGHFLQKEISILFISAWASPPPTSFTPQRRANFKDCMCEWVGW